MLPYQPTPLVKIDLPHWRDAGVEVSVKREDLNHPVIRGNKWWKLRDNLKAAAEKNHDTLLTFGGAWSNHIRATAAAANDLGFSSVGVIRGERVDPLNPVLHFAEKMGMHLHFVNRSDYRLKDTATFSERLRNQFGRFYMIPEGGSNDLAVEAVADFARQQLAAHSFTHVCCAVGTGGTVAGLIRGLAGKTRVVGVPVLKGAIDYLEGEVKNWVKPEIDNWELVDHFHFGGYARTSPSLFAFMNNFQTRFNIPLDPVYMGKVMYAVFEMIEKGRIPANSKVLVLHTGGY